MRIDESWKESAMSWLAASLQNHLEIALFLALGLGQAAARLHIGSFKPNAVVCVLLAGVAVGQLGIKPPPVLQWSFFVLFLFAVGYKTGPQFFEGLGAARSRRSGYLCSSAPLASQARISFPSSSDSTLEAGPASWPAGSELLPRWAQSKMRFQSCLSPKQPGSNSPRAQPLPLP